MRLRICVYLSKFLSMKLIFTCSLFIFCQVCVLAQEVYEILPPAHIKTIHFSSNKQPLGGTPIVPIGTGLHLTFDDIRGNETDYYYKIEHLNFDWTPSGLSKNEVMSGFDTNRIRDYQNSSGTLQSYTHYHLQIPNETTKALKVSGNYILKILNEDDEIVFSRKFIVYEQLLPVSVLIKRSRNLSFIDRKQVVNFSVGHNFGGGQSAFLIRNPKETVRTMVIQNNDLHTAIKDLKPQYTVGNKLVYRYDQASSFWGGNEYLSFDSKDLRAANLHTSRVTFNKVYHHHLYTDGMRMNRPYTYDPDINGRFKINATEGRNDAIEADYVQIHFSLQSDQNPNGGHFFLYGNFNNFALTNENKLVYNAQKDIYETSLLLKQGYYDYKYILLNQDGTVNSGFVSGNFDKTENQYVVLVYYRELGGRYDRIIGAGSANSRDITN